MTVLVQKPIKVGTVVTFRLLTGEEIVGGWDSETADAVVITKPVVLGQNQQGMGFIPVLFTALPDRVSFKKQGLLIDPIATQADIANKYLENTTSIKLL